MIPFPVTHRSVLERIRSGDGTVRRAAFDDLAAGYWRPSYHYLRLHWRLTPEAAEDVVQAFFAVAFEKGYLEKYDPGRARFRTFFRTCLDRFVHNVRKAELAGKRGGGARPLPLDFPGAEQELALVAARDRSDPDRFFHVEVVRALFGATVDAVREEFESAGRSPVFDVFEMHDLAPGPDASYASVAEACGLTVPQVTNYLHAARRRFREIALERLRALVGTDEEFRAEAREIFGVDVSR